MTPPLSRWARRVRRLAVALAVLGLAGLLTAPADARPRGSDATTQEYLVVADPQAKALHVYRASDHRRTGSLHDIAISTHGGTLPLPDGRLIVVDDANARVAAISISSRGKPRIVKSAVIPSSRWEGMTWGAADPSLRYLAFGGQPGDGVVSPIMVVDLDTFDISHHDLQLSPDGTGTAPETQVYLAGNPLRLVMLGGSGFSSMLLSSFLGTEYLAGCPIGRPRCFPIKSGSNAPSGDGAHGPVVARDGSAVFTTTAKGFAGANVAERGLTDARRVAYSTDTRDIPNSFHPRLAADERMVWGAVTENPAVPVERWATARNDVSIVDSATYDTRLVRVPDGKVSRLAISSTYAAVSTIHPEGDALTLLDADRDSATFGRIVGTVAIPSSTAGPVAGGSIVGTQPHFVTLDPDGRRAYVSNGGDGEVTVVDTERRRVVGTIRTPTPLNDGGYLVVVKPGAPVHDLIPR